ncbi:MAG: AAA family ATPase [Atopobiaceae bacterium]|nr:AAA family ATPase [Atopobiaceae bacterium]
MALNKDTMAIIDAVAKNDLPRARAAALAAVANDTAASRSLWRNSVRAALESHGVDEAHRVPEGLRGKIVLEDSQAFRVGRYTLDARGLEVCAHVRRMRRACDRLAGMGIRYANATLMHGEPGTGKTTLARYVAYEQQLPFAYLSFANLIDSYMGATSRNIHEVFSFATSFPCVLLLDELDTIAASRTTARDGAAKELSRVTVTLMQELDRLPNGMVLLAATNRPDIVDPALARRFTRHVEITRPRDPDEVHCIVENYLDDCGLCYDVDVMESICGSWEGPMPTQDAVVNGLVEAIADHVLKGRDEDRRAPVSLRFLEEMRAGA